MYFPFLYRLFLSRWKHAREMVNDSNSNYVTCLWNHRQEFQYQNIQSKEINGKKIDCFLNSFCLRTHGLNMTKLVRLNDYFQYGFVLVGDNFLVRILQINGRYVYCIWRILLRDFAFRWVKFIVFFLFQMEFYELVFQKVLFFFLNCIKLHYGGIEHTS